MDFNTLAATMVPYLLPPLLTACFALATYLYHGIVTRLPAQLHARVDAVAQQAVAAIEQSMAGSPGQAKKKAATELVNQVLDGMRLQAAEPMIDAAIESAVFALKQFASHAAQPAPFTVVQQSNPVQP